MIMKLFRNRKGQGLVEYGLIIAGVALICAAAVSIFGHKTSDLIAAVATVLPGAHSDDNNSIASGKLIETGENANGDLQLDVEAIAGNSGNARLGDNVGIAIGTGGTITTDAFGGLVTEAN